MATAAEACRVAGISTLKLGSSLCAAASTTDLSSTALRAFLIIRGPRAGTEEQVAAQKVIDAVSPRWRRCVAAPTDLGLGQTVTSLLRHPSSLTLSVVVRLPLFRLLQQQELW